jgi:hypothetical protein
MATVLFEMVILVHLSRGLWLGSQGAAQVNGCLGDGGPWRGGAGDRVEQHEVAIGQTQDCRQACDLSSPESGDSPDRDSPGRDRSRVLGRAARESALTGLLDRSALFGVLADIEALGLDLLEVRQLPPDRKSSESGDSRSQ